MAWLAVDCCGQENIFENKPHRNGDVWEDLIHSSKEVFNNKVCLSKGTINKLIGKNLTWDDGPVKV